jgi:hypothetical protein
LPFYLLCVEYLSLCVPLPSFCSFVLPVFPSVFFHTVFCVFLFQLPNINSNHSSN